MADAPTPADPSLTALIDNLRNRFEEGCRTGNPPPVEEFVQEAPESARTRLLSELRAIERNYLGRTPALPTRVEGRDPTPTPRTAPGEPAETLRFEAVRPVTPEVASDTEAGSLPESVGGYRVVRLLGRGGMGSVYLADDTLARRRVAIKVMRAELAGRAGARERFLREARAAAAVEHDHVVPVYQVGVEGGTPFIVMPALGGESLHSRLARDPKLDLALVMKVGREVALGLAAAHQQRLVHRDVKPANIWLEGDPNAADLGERVRRVRVLDFGLARATEGSDGLTQPGALLGTPAFMPPEQADGKEVDTRADLFSLGAVLYRMAAGRPAFSGPTVTSVLLAVASHNPPPPHEVNPAVPRGLSDLVMRLLEKDPARRPASAAAVAAELAAPLSNVSPGPHRSRRAVWLVGAGVAVLALAIAALALTRPKHESDNAANPPADPPRQQPAALPAAPPKYRGSVDVLVLRQDDDRTPRLFPLSDPRAMPLRTGDEIRIRAEVNPAAYVYLFWIDEAGAGAPVYPWELGKWGTRPAPADEKPVESVDVKSPSGKTPRITGAAAGMETLLMIARPTRLEAPDSEIRNWFAELKPLVLRGPRSRVWFEDFDLLWSDPSRGVSYDGDPASPDGPLGLQQVLRQRIGANASFSRAISFARLGKKEQK